LTALSLITTGTYDSLPRDLLDAFITPAPISDAAALEQSAQLDQHILYRLRCTDFVPSELAIERVQKGRVYARGGGLYGWRAELAMDESTEGGNKGDMRWWLEDVEWTWKAKDRTVDDPGGLGFRTKTPKRFSLEERQHILDMANFEVLPTRLVDGKKTVPLTQRTVETSAGTPVTAGRVAVAKVGVSQIKVDAPLSRLHNFLRRSSLHHRVMLTFTEHLSLSYQLEVLCSQAVALSQGRWRGNLMIDMDRQKKQLRIKYWV
jgi:mediator of RNA polymerase II transcription subunit 14